MNLALLALLIVTLVVLTWRAVTRDRRDYARFKRLRSTKLRQQVFGRWILESMLVLGGLAGALLLAAWPYVPLALRDVRAWGPLAGVPYGSDTATGILVGVGVALLVAMVVPILLLARTKLDEIPAIGDIKALLPRNRGELPYGAGLALTAGVVEELLFRLALPAAVFGVLGGQGTGSGIVAFGVAAVVFGLLHIYQGAQGILFAFLLGLVFTALYVLSGNILVPIVLHALIDLRSLVLIPVVLGSAGKPEPRTVAP
ncbi:MAG: CPBP family glutamic-type intramembrane protease [Pseudolysinimonas sp.]